MNKVVNWITSKLKRVNLLCVVGVSVYMSMAVGAWAQPSVPSTIDPGRVDKKYQEPLKPLSKPEGPVIIKQPKRLPVPQAKELKFIFSDILFDGVTVYTPNQLKELFKDKLGREISLVDIYSIADSITAKYRNDGYILSQVIVPPQTIERGNVLLHVIEGYVDDVVITGDIRGNRKILERFGQKMVASKPFNNAVLEHYSLLANDLFGAKIKTNIMPSKDQVGAATIVFSAQHTLINSSISMDNRGTRSVGPLEFTVGSNLNSLLGMYEQISAVAVVTKDPREQKYLALTYQQPVGSEGAVISLSANGNRSEPDGDVMRLLEVETKSDNYSVTYKYPFIRSRERNLRSRIGYEHRKSESLQLNQTTSLDKISLVTLGVTYDFVDKSEAINLIDIELVQGLDFINVTKTGSANLSRADGKSDFTKIDLEVTRTQPLSANLGIQLGLMGQYSFSDLLSSQEFGFGGSQYGRAYDSSEITGEHGIAFKAELQYTRPVNWRVIKSCQLFSFYDVGKVWQSSSLPGEDSLESASSAGLGMRFNAPLNISGSMEMAKPLTRPVAAEEPGGYDWRAFFNLSISF